MPLRNLSVVTSRRFHRILPGWSKRTIHFLHIGKNAGTQIKNVIRQINAQRQDLRIKRHGHRVSLGDLPDDDDFFFSIRDPISRFRSGFYSRKRKGQPRIYIDWSRFEAKAFDDFEHANDLAEALFCDGELGAKAFCAMKSIRHVTMNQVDWISHFGNLLELRPPLCIIRQEKFDVDVRALKERVGFAGEIEIEKDPTKSHANDYSDTPALSEEAVSNLNRWYVQDIEFYRVCEDWIERNRR